MSEQNEHAEGKAICNEIGGAVLEVLGRKSEFAVQSLIDVLKAEGMQVVASCEFEDKLRI